MQTLVTLPDTTTPIPIQALHRLSVEATPLHPSRPSPSTSQVDEVTSYGDINLDELIELQKFDLASITIEKMSIVQDALARKKYQELLRREHRQKQELNDIKDIFLDAFILPTLDEQNPIIKKLENIVEKINDEDLDTNVKLLEWLEQKFQTKVNEKISSVIALNQDELATKIDDVKQMLEKFSLFTPSFVMYFYSHKKCRDALTIWREISREQVKSYNNLPVKFSLILEI